MAELDDETPLREALLDAGMRLELGEITEEEHARAEAIILARMREVHERRQAGARPIAQGKAAPRESVAVEASILGDFHQPAPAVAPRRRSAAKRRRVRLPSAK